MTKLSSIGALVLVGLVGCGGSLPKGVFGEVSPAEGTITLTHQGKAPVATDVLFRNDGTSDVTISDLTYKLVGQAPEAAQGSFALAAGDTIAHDLCVVAPDPHYDTLDSLTFTVEGRTEKLSVLLDEEEQPFDSTRSMTAGRF